MDAASFTVTSASPEATEALGAAWGAVLARGDLLLLLGDLGAGKTTLVRGLARGLGVEAQVKSPTFAIHLTYPGRLELHHLDLYRVTRAPDLEELGLGDWLGLEGAAVIEWGERMDAPPWSVRVRVTETGETARAVAVSGPRGAVERLASALTPAPAIAAGEGTA